MTKSPDINDVREYWDRRPCNIRHSAKALGSREYFDEVEKRKYFVEPHIPGFAEFELWRGKKVLEIGCGIGTDAVNFARQGADYSAIELSEESLNITRERFSIYGLSGNFSCGNAEAISTFYPHQQFDLVYSFGVIHHTPNPEKVIQEIRKVIKPSGELRIMLYAKSSWKAHMIDAGHDQPEAQFGCPIATTFDKDSAKKLLRGFEIVSIEQDHIFPYKITPYKEYRYEKEEWFAAMPDDMFRALEKSLGWHLLIKARPLD